MSIGLMSELIKAVIFPIAVLCGLIWVFRQGKKEQEAEQNENTLDNIKKAQSARRDPVKRAIAKRVFKRGDK